MGTRELVNDQGVRFMFHLFLHLVLLVPSAYCSKQYHTSGSSGPYAFALAFGAPYFPSSQELEVDGHRRLELLSTKFLAVHFLDPGVPVENSAIDVESEFNGMSGVADIHKAMHLRHTGESGVPIATNELCFRDPVPSVAEMPSEKPQQRDLGSSYDPCLLNEPRNRDLCPPIIPGKLKNVKILRSVNMGPHWSFYELPFCNSRVVVFGNWEEDIHRILEVMIKFGQITYAWAIEDLHYARSNVYFFEYQSYRDAQTAVSDAVGPLVLYLLTDFSRDIVFTEELV